jgi:hypothetical protein
MTDPDAAGGGGEYQVVVGMSPHVCFCYITNLTLILPSSQDLSSSILPDHSLPISLELTTRIRMDKRRSPLPSR